MSAKKTNELVWSAPHPVEPDAGTWRVGYLPDPRHELLPPPPANDSEQTREELAELEELTHHRTRADVAQILRWSVNESSPDTHWSEVADEMCRLYQLSPPAAARVHAVMAEAIYLGLIAAWANKYRYLRPRPSMLDPDIDVSVIPVPEHPAYPSGHSTNAGAASKVLTHFFPDQAERFRKLADDAGLSRLKAGIHYRSDHEAGLALGRRVAKRVLKGIEHDGAPESYP